MMKMIERVVLAYSKRARQLTVSMLKCNISLKYIGRHSIVVEKP